MFWSDVPLSFMYTRCRLLDPGLRFAKRKMLFAQCYIKNRENFLVLDEAFS